MEGVARVERGVAELLDAAPLTRLHIRVWLLAAMGVMLDGFDFFIMGVAIPLIQADWAPSTLEVSMLSAAAVLGAMVGAASIGRLTDRLGRRLVFKLDLAMFVVFALASALAPNIGLLIAFRFLLGIGVGADYPISASYVAEISPARPRPRLLVGAFAFQAVGQLMGVAVGLVIMHLYPQPEAWRWMLGFGVIPAFVIVVLRRGVPESPRWLARNGDVDEAREVCSRFAGTDVSAEAVRAYAARDDGEVPYRALFGRRFRRRTVLTAVPWFFMDIATYGVGVFTPTIIAAIGVSAASSGFMADDIASAKGSAFVDLFLVAGFGLAILVINRVDHLRLQIAGFAAMVLGLVVLAWVSALPGGGDAHVLGVFVGFSVFNLFMNMGPNSTTFLLPAEVFPTEVRATGHGLATSCGKAGAALGLFCFPLFQADLGLSTTLLLVAGGCVVALVVTRVFRVPTASPA